MQEPPNVRTVVLRVAALSLLLLLVLIATITTRALGRVPNTLVYFVKVEVAGHTLGNSARHLPKAPPEQHLRSTLQLLIKGTTATEEQRGLATTFPPDMEILDIRLRGTELEVDLPRTFSEGDATVLQSRLHQLFYTLSQPSYVDSVRLFIEGVPTTYLGRSVQTDNPWHRAAHETLPSW